MGLERIRMLDDPRHLGALIGRIYDCALRPEGWLAVFTEIAGLIDAKRGMIGMGVVAGPTSILNVQIGLDDFAGETAERYAPINPVVPMGLVWPFDRAMVVSRDFGFERLQATRFYRGVLEPRGDRDMVAFLLSREGDAIGHWLLITQTDRGLISDEEAERLEWLAPHVRRAVEISNVLGMQRVAAETYRDALDRLDAAVLIVDEARRVVFANPRAGTMLEAGDVLQVRSGRVTGSDAQNERILGAALGEAGAGPSANRPGGREAVLTGAGGAERLMFAVTLDALHDNPFTAPGRSTLLVLRAPREDTRNPIAIAARVFNLTPTQVQVLAYLAQGLAPDDIADVLGLSVKTVRSHLAELFRRTGTERQSELVARTLSVASPLRTDTA